MSLQPRPAPTVPEETARVAKAALKRDQRYLRLRDEIGVLYEDHEYRELFATTGQPGLSPAQLIMVCVLQFAEGLSDRQAADAVASRIDWKYVLGLPLAASGFDASVLSEFRARLVANHAQSKLLDQFVARMQQAGLVRAGGKQRTDATHVVANIRQRNRLELVGETMRQALELLAQAIPTALQSFAPSEWFERYSRPLDNYRLPKGERQRQALAETIGQDGAQLLRWLELNHPPLLHGAAVQALQLIWPSQYLTTPEGQLRWRRNEELPAAAERPASPHDLEARYSRKRELEWVGYKSHLTECCADSQHPALIVNVQTTPATTSDESQLPLIHQQLAERQLLPQEHLVDSAYVDADNLVESRERYGIELRGPVRQDPSWQAKAAAGFASDDFIVEWQQQQAICPGGERSVSWKPGTHSDGKAIIRIAFERATCRDCPLRASCTNSAAGPRVLTVRPEAQHEALRSQRRVQKSAEFKSAYASRAGIEGTLSQAVRVAELRHARYRSQSKVHLQGIFTALAINLLRLGAWLADRARAAARTSAFASLRAPTLARLAPAC